MRIIFKVSFLGKDDQVKRQVKPRQKKESQVASSITIARGLSDDGMTGSTYDL